MKLATLAYVRRDDCTLMMHRNKKAADMHEGKWNGLGGKFEAGETPEACLQREVYEESGLHVKQAHLKGFITFPDFDGADDWYTFVYLVTDFSGTLKASAEGDLHWIPTRDLLKLNVWEGDRIFLPWLDEDKFFSARFAYQAGVLKTHEVAFY